MDYRERHERAEPAGPAPALPRAATNAYIMVGNEVSERMTERAGFRREGVLRAWELLRGEPVDCVVYSRLRNDDISQ